MKRKVLSTLMTAAIMGTLASPIAWSAEASGTEKDRLAGAAEQTVSSEKDRLAGAAEQTASSEKDILSWAGETFESEKDVLAGVTAETETEEAEDGNVTITEKTVPWYLFSLDNTFDTPVYFIDGVTDLPYVNLDDWAEMMVTIYHMCNNPEYTLYVENDGPLVMFTRESNYSMLFDFEEGTIRFDDFDAFIHATGDASLMDMVSLEPMDEEGNPLLLQKLEKGSFDRYGKEVELRLVDYAIHMVWSEEDNLYLVPIQTMADFLTALPFGINSYFNEEAVYLASQDDLGVGQVEKTDIGKSFFMAPYGNMSEELAWYSYCELCLVLDNLYGLKESHDITSFDRIFTETGYRQDLCSTDPNVADGALNDFIDYYLDDLHSGFNCASYRTEEILSVGGGKGLSRLRDEMTSAIYEKAREEADTPIVPYEEVGNTAYVTFDGFGLYAPTPEFYYEGDMFVDEEEDTIASIDTAKLVLYAHERITRKDSPIENVVMDLSLNGGGQANAAAIVAAWYLGEAAISVRSSLTGAISTATYRFDANLDHQFDEKDCVLDKNLFCLIGPYSFSCGNLVPSIFRSSNRVTLLGKTSGGGSCSILCLSTAYGASFQISSPYRLSYLKNGSYYDTDTGIVPDCYIMKPENFYDREALTEYINQLF